MINEKGFEHAMNEFVLGRLDRSEKQRLIDAITTYLPHHESELVRALEFYADNFKYPFNYPIQSCRDNKILQDGGFIASKALANHKGEGV